MMKSIDYRGVGPEGIIPALESAHAVSYAAKLAPTLPKNKSIVINISGRGDKDCQ